MKGRILLVYPVFPVTYWSFHSVFKYTKAKASYPPLGLLTLAAMIPKDYELQVVDLNVENITDEMILKSDVVFISAMLVQKDSFEETVKHCNRLEKPVVAGGPYATASYESITGVDHFVLGECEEILSNFFSDYEKGGARKIYEADGYPDIKTTPAPRFDLINTDNYYSMALQFSRGCPFNCEFCDVIELFGRIPRTKTPEQMIKEFDVLYDEGFNGSLFIVDDNFIGNKSKTKDFLRSIIPWQRQRKYPFTLYTEASINLADDDEMSDLMVEAGFNMVFIGIETPSVEALKETGKSQNLRGNKTLLQQIHHIQQKGLEVSAGFIVGFDTDDESIFDRQKDFIQNSAIPMAMIGLLQALPSSQLYKRLEREERLVGKTAGNNTHDLALNFEPRMNKKNLVQGYANLLTQVYDSKNYFKRVYDFLEVIPKKKYVVRNVDFEDIKILLKFISSKFLSFEGRRYLKFLLKVLIKKTGLFPEAARFLIMGEHLMTITKDITKHHSFKSLIESNIAVIGPSLKLMRDEQNAALENPFLKYIQLIKKDVEKRYKDLPASVKLSARIDFEDFITKLDEMIDEISIAHSPKEIITPIVESSLSEEIIVQENIYN